MHNAMLVSPRAVPSAPRLRAACPPLRAVVGGTDSRLCDRVVLILERSGLEVVAAVGGPDRLVSEALHRCPDVIVSVTRGPRAEAGEDVRVGLTLRHLLPRTGLVLLSQALSRQEALGLLATGPSGVGYLRPERVLDAAQFVADVRRVGTAGTVVDPALGSEETEPPAPAGDRVARLTARQRHVLALVAQGLSNAAIARSMFITEKSVVEHVSRIYDVLELPRSGAEHRRVLAVLRLLSTVTGMPGLS